MIEVRWATPADVDRFYGERPHQSFRALVIADGDTVHALGGVYYTKENAVAFMDLHEGARPLRKSMVKAMKIAMERLVATSRLPVIAICSEDEPTAPGLLRHFGFEPIEEGVYQWRG